MEFLLGFTVITTLSAALLWSYFSEQDKAAPHGRHLVGRLAFLGWVLGLLVLAIGLAVLLDVLLSRTMNEFRIGQGVGAGGWAAASWVATRRLRHIGASPWFATAGLVLVLCSFLSIPILHVLPYTILLGCLSLMLIPGKNAPAAPAPAPPSPSPSTTSPTSPTSPTSLASPAPLQPHAEA